MKSWRDHESGHERCVRAAVLLVSAASGAELPVAPLPPSLPGAWVGCEWCGVEYIITCSHNPLFLPASRMPGALFTLIVGSVHDEQT